MREREMDEEGADESSRDEVEGRIHFFHHFAQTSLKVLSRPRNLKEKGEEGRDAGELERKDASAWKRTTKTNFDVFEETFPRHLSFTESSINDRRVSPVEEVGDETERRRVR